MISERPVNDRRGEWTLGAPRSSFERYSTLKFCLRRHLVTAQARHSPRAVGGKADPIRGDLRPP